MHYLWLLIKITYLSVLIAIYTASCSNQPVSNSQLSSHQSDDYYLDFYKHQMVTDILEMKMDRRFYYPGVFQYKVSFQSTLEFVNGVGKKKVFYFYQQKNGVNTPLVIIFPPLVDATPWDYLFAGYLAKMGISVAIMPYDERIAGERSIDKIDEYTIRVIDKAQSIVDLASKLPNVDENRIMISGLSLGAIMGSIALGVDQRLMGGALYMAGGDMIGILARSDLVEISAYRERKMEKFGITDREEFYHFLKKNVHLDPLDLAHRANRENIYMFVTEEDTGIPTENQTLLWEALGRPKTHHIFNKYYYDSRHYTGGLIFPYYMEDIATFIKQRMDAAR